MCRHRISRRLTLPALLARCGGVETAREPLWAQGAGQDRILENPVYSRATKKVHELVPAGTLVDLLRVRSLRECQETHRVTNYMPTHRILA